MKSLKFYLFGFAAAIFLTVPLSVSSREASPTSAANLELARQLNQAFVQVAEQVSPAVVVITVTEKSSAPQRLSPGDEDYDPWEEFRRFLDQRQQGEQTPAPPEKTIGQGSGIIIRSNGFILTNRHVVEDAEKIEVRLQDGRTFNAEVRGVDGPADVAVIKIDAAGLTVAKLGDSDKSRVGEFAIAIGAPFALEYSVTFGHVSAKNRSDIITPDSENYNPMLDQNFIQTDANINPGNSGGPLVNIEGEVIGINTLIRGLHTGIGFAIPINLARQVADKLIVDGKFTRAWLGIGIKALREEPNFRDLFKGLRDGVVVTGVVLDGPASKSNLRPEDVILSIDGKTVVTSQQLKDEIRGKKVGQEVALEIYRKNHDGGKRMQLTVKTGEYVDKNELAGDDATPGGEGKTNVFGINVGSLERLPSRKLNLPGTEGVVVTGIDKNGLAAQNGIQEGDIITSIDERPVKNLRQFREALKNVDVKKGATIHFISDGTAKFELLKKDGD